MGMQIIPERESGRFAIFSSETDTFVVRDITAKQVYKFFEDIAIDQARDRVLRIFEKLAAGEKPSQFALTIEEAEEEDRKHRA